MLRLNRTTEYGIFALRHLSQKEAEESASAREIADRFGLPFDITAKTLQRLKDAGLIASAQGSRGGYRLNCSLQEVNLAEFLELMEGPQSVVACADAELTASGQGCGFSGRCQISSVLKMLDVRVKAMLATVKLSEFAVGSDASLSFSSADTAAAGVLI